MEYTLKRILRLQDSEKWLCYGSEKGKFVRDDTVFVSFGNRQNDIYIFSIYEGVKRDSDYVNCVLGLVHDTRTEDGFIHDFELHFIDVPKEMTEDEQIDWIDSKIKEIKII
ncbi:hypothetical protein [[Clostridium] polysaccharolyticum]|uniref:Uncharacterized protein n=1 Tax=[Clostridium] polysaccharolyticum TaxID=29364 RepID=A0A1H9Z7U3_9FIRM|nr:hypothetical protein [[Clostridium] polysaccharolyticum]SES77603.1 hypothetical protein SAMN04487772_10345 [[Clostridium] polysaccharolyticum]